MYVELTDTKSGPAIKNPWIGQLTYTGSSVKGLLINVDGEIKSAGQNPHALDMVRMLMGYENRIKIFRTKPP
jgi:hypothetical protein